MIKASMAIFDIDGTLTNSKKELTVPTIEALMALQEQGVVVVLASGRPTYGIMPLAEKLQLSKYGGYILSYNGGVIIDCKSGEEIYSNTLPNSLVAPLCEASKEEGCVILSYDNEFIVTEKSEDKYVAIEAHLNKMKVREVVSFSDAITTDVPKCLSVGEPEKVIKLEARLKAQFGDVMNIYRSEPFFLELVPQNIDKAHSLNILIEKIGVAREATIAFGDGFNDLSMIEFAATGIAMANAQDEVKKRADIVIGSNDEDGIAEFVRENSFLVL